MLTTDWKTVYPMAGLKKDRPNVNSAILTNGTRFYAMDEQKMYIFDAENKEWHEIDPHFTWDINY